MTAALKSCIKFSIGAGELSEVASIFEDDRGVELRPAKMACFCDGVTSAST